MAEQGIAMLLGWPITILLILAIIAIVYFYMRADRDYQRRKLEIVQKRLAAIDAQKEAVQMEEVRGENLESARSTEDESAAKPEE